MTIPPTSWLPIRTARLLVRDFRASDFEDVHAYASDPEVARYVVWGPNTRDETQTFLGLALAAQTASPRLDFNLAIEVDGAVAGD